MLFLIINCKIHLTGKNLDAYPQICIKCNFFINRGQPKRDFNDIKIQDTAYPKTSKFLWIFFFLKEPTSLTKKGKKIDHNKLVLKLVHWIRLILPIQTSQTGVTLRESHHILGKKRTQGEEPGGKRRPSRHRAAGLAHRRATRSPSPAWQRDPRSEILRPAHHTEHRSGSNWKSGRSRFC